MARRVSDIKVQIQDPDALALVKPAALLDLVERCGVEQKQERKQAEHGVIGWQLKLFTSPDEEPRWIFIPARVEFADYPRRVAEAIADIAEVSGQSQLAVLLELLGITDELPELSEA